MSIAFTSDFLVSEIPYFKEVLIMATNCDTCGYRTNEVKSGTGIEPQGIRIEVSVTDTEDLTRDILKVRLFVMSSVRTSGTFR